MTERAPLAADVAADVAGIRLSGDLSQWPGSPACTRTMWEGGVAKHQEVVVDDEIWPRTFPSCRDYAISADGQHTAATVQMERLGEGDTVGFMKGLWTVAVDGEPWDERFINAYTPAISPDGAQVAFSWAGEDGGDVDLYLKQQNTE